MTEKKELEKKLYPLIEKKCKEHDIYVMKTTGNAREQNGRADHTGMNRQGRRVEIETKLPDGIVSHDQKIYLQLMEQYNVFVSVVFNPEDIFNSFTCKYCNKICFGNFCIYCGKNNF